MQNTTPTMTFAGGLPEPTLAEDVPAAALLASQQDDSGDLDEPARAQPGPAAAQPSRAAHPASLESILAVRLLQIVPIRPFSAQNH